MMDEKIFEEAAPNLFDCSFEKMKERVESIKLLSTSKSSCLVATPVFKNSPPREVEAKQTGGGFGRRNLPISNLTQGPTRVRDSKNVFYYQKDHSIINLLAQRTVTPLAVDKSIIAGRVALFKNTSPGF